MKKLLVLLTAAILATNGFSEVFKIVAIPDTQNLAEFNPENMAAQTQWIVDNAAAENIAFVTHLGDVVDNNVLFQWDNATDALDLLDGVVPYSVCIGNHDYTDLHNRQAGVAEYVARFGPSRYSGYSWYKGSHHDLDHYQIFSADGRDWLHLNLEFAPDSEGLLWAQRVLDAHPDLPALFSTHTFLTREGVLSISPSASEWGEPSRGGLSMWSQFVSQNDQIFLVMNGHHFTGTDGVANTNIVNAFGHDVFMMCVNYQYDNADAHMRILEFDSTAGEINATTYDPNTANFLTDSENQFTLSMDFSARLDSFSARETFSTIQAANITVVESDLLNSNNSVTVSIPAGQSTADISVVPVGTTEYTDHSNGDYYIQAGNVIEDDYLGGIMLASVAQNGRTSIDGTNYYHVAAAPAGSHGQYWIATHTTANNDAYPGYTGGVERDVNIAVAYFPFAQGWTCGRIENYTNNAPQWALVGSENIELGVELIQVPQGTLTGADTNLLKKTSGPDWPNADGARGIWNLNIPGVDSIQDGILLVCGGKNEGNYAAASPWTDGSGWQISVHDSSGTGITESDPWNFAYVPYSTESIVAGRGCVTYGKLGGTGGFTMVSNGVGSVRLDIAGYTPADGALIVSTENHWYASDDFTTYEATPTNWIIQTRDLPGATLVNSAASQFAFLFIPFVNAPAGPEKPSVPPTDPATISWNSSAFDNTGVIEKEMGTSQFDISGTLILADNSGGLAMIHDGISYTDGAINMGSTYGSYHSGNTVSDFGTYSVVPGAKTVTLGSGGVGTIVSGKTYRIQLLLMDGRPAQTGLTVEVDGVNQGQYANGVLGVTYGDGLLITGTFTADSDSKSFTIEVFSGATSGGGQLNALLLHEIDPDGVIAWSSSDFVNQGTLQSETGTGQFDTSGTLIFADNTIGSALTFDGIDWTAGAIEMGSVYSNYHSSSASEVSHYGTYNSRASARNIRLGAGGAGTIVPGQTYRIQLLIMDGRFVQAGKTVELNGLNMGIYSHGVRSVTYGDGMIVSGTFTSESDSKTFAIETFDGVISRGGQLNALLLTRIGSTYDQWALDYGLTGGATGDDDGDGLDNLSEFGLGGNPTNDLDLGYATSTSSDGTWLNYVYPKRSDPHSGLIYYLESTDDLIFGTWTNSGYTELGTIGTGDPDFNTVSNQVSTTNDQQFIRLRIQEQ